jgi:glycosyltransferase involved in cell wall biosynthesis
VHRAKAVVAGWQGAADQLSREYGVPLRKMRVIPTAVPAARFPEVDDARRRAAREQFDAANCDRVVCYLGALSAEKNCAAAIAAIAEVRDATLLVAGSGPDRPELEQLANELAPDRVQFLGAVTNPQDVLGASDALILPSATEGTPGVAIEAGLTGIPVVATDVGGVREIVLNDETGVVVPTGDLGALVAGLRRALDRSAEFGKRAREHCLARFEIAAAAAAWDELLGELGAWTNKDG